MKIMKTLFILAAVVAVASSILVSDREAHRQWSTFKTTYVKTYENDAEESHRLKIFRENLNRIAEHNALFEKGEVTFKVGVNKHADLSSNEIKAMLNGFRLRQKTKSQKVHVSSAKPWPWSKKIDWRNEGYVTPVKDQGRCGSCWAFSATGALEGQLFKKTSKLVSLSEQNLIDCSSSYGNKGCDGGLMDYAFQYVNDNGGVETEASYPYISDVTLSTGECSYNASNTAGTVTGYIDININEKDLQDAVTRVGPISVGIDASHWNFHFYSSGIYYEKSCSSDDLDHGVLVVGYSSDWLNRQYWIVKNSWGEDWGENGYFKIARNKNNHCGIATMASYPNV